VIDPIAVAARDFPDPFRLLIREESASTNDELHELARHGAPEGLVLVAKNQTSGRGRRGASWFAAPGESLALSILLRPTEPKSHWPRLALASGLALAETAETFDISAGIKWPNDVWIDQRKVAGILVEAGADYVIVGIGLNVNARSFPSEIAHLATSLHLAHGHPIPMEDVLGRLIHRFAIRHRQIGHDFPILLAAIRERCVLTDHAVSLQTSTGQLTGTVHGIADDGALLVHDGQQLHRLIQADEVRLI
jgi:BirA family biotin operon repressor/biotin-[acetyl-CoA-carboxylase] ligase